MFFVRRVSYRSCDFFLPNQLALQCENCAYARQRSVIDVLYTK